MFQAIRLSAAGLVLASATWGLTSAGSPAEAGTIGHAVIVGPEKFTHQSVSDQRYSGDDAEAFGAVLAQNGWQVRVLVDNAEKASLLPSQKNIRDSLGWLSRASSYKDETVLFAYFGHGVQFAIDSEAYIFPTEGQPIRKQANSLIRTSEIYKTLAQSSAASKLVILDAGRNDPSAPYGARGGLNTQGDQAVNPQATSRGGKPLVSGIPPGFGVLLGCSPGQRSYEFESLKHGLLAASMLEGLAGKAAGPDGSITALSLFSYAVRDVPKRSAILVNHRQTPQLQTNLLATTVVIPKGREQRTKEPKPNRFLSLNPAPRQYALVVGVSDYHHSNFTDLKYATNDAEKLSEVLSSAGYEVETLTNRAATKGAIEQAIIRLRRKAKQPEDTVLVALAGHGRQPSGSDEAFFCPVDGINSERGLASYVSIHKFLYPELADSLAGTKLVFVDACRDDPFAPRGSRGFSAGSSKPPPQGIVVAYACAKGQQAWEDPEVRHGVFFFEVIQALKTAKDKPLSAPVMLAQIIEPVSVRARKVSGRLQQPAIDWRSVGLPLVLSGSRPSTREVRHEELVRAITDHVEKTEQIRDVVDFKNAIPAYKSIIEGLRRDELSSVSGHAIAIPSPKTWEFRRDIREAIIQALTDAGVL
ncbi:MAG: caspase family protein [Planctomycetota bacterium]